TVVSGDDAALRDIDRPFPIDTQAPQGHFRISGPLLQEVSRRVKDLNATSAVLAYIDIAPAIHCNAPRVGHHAGADAFLAKLEQHIRETVRGAARLDQTRISERRRH